MILNTTIFLQTSLSQISLRLIFLVTFLEVLGRSLDAKLLGIDQRLECFQRTRGLSPGEFVPPRITSNITNDSSKYRGLGSDFVPLSATPHLTLAVTSADLGWPSSETRQGRRKRARFTVLTELDDSE